MFVFPIKERTPAVRSRSGHLWSSAEPRSTMENVDPKSANIFVQSAEPILRALSLLESWTAKYRSGRRKSFTSTTRSDRWQDGLFIDQPGTSDAWQRVQINLSQSLACRVGKNDMESIRHAPQTETCSHFCSGKNGKQPGAREVRPHIDEQIEAALSEQSRGKSQSRNKKSHPDNTFLFLLSSEKAV